MSKPDFKAMAAETTHLARRSMWTHGGRVLVMTSADAANMVATALQSAYEAGVADMKERCAGIADAEASVEGIGQRIAAAIRSQP